MRSKIVVALFAGALAIAVAPQQPAAQQGRSGGDWWGHGWMGMGRGHMWQDGGRGGMWGWNHMGPGQRQRMQRHWTYMNEGVPAEYRGARSTVRATPETIAAGEKLYAANCASCHGPEGMGDGEEGRGLVPSPALIKYFVQMPMAGDEYLLWTISEGGAEFGTDMPAFKDTLEEDEIWQIVTYMRSGFPKTAEAQ